MALAITSDPILADGISQSLLGVDEKDLLAVLVNGLTDKFKRFTNRIKVNYDGTNTITETMRVHSFERQFLHASPVVTDGTHDLEVTLLLAGETIETYKYSDGEVLAHSADHYAWIEMVNGSWPDPQTRSLLQVEYYGGFSTVPGDVIQGAILQGKVDLARLKGEAGVGNRSYGGESVAFEPDGLIKAVRDLWGPYRVLV